MNITFQSFNLKDMLAIKYKVTLATDGKLYLEPSKAAAGYPDKDIMHALNVSSSMVSETCKRCVEKGVEMVLKNRPRPGKALKLAEKQAAHVLLH